MTKPYATFQTPLEKLQDFYKAVVDLTIKHRVIEIADSYDEDDNPETMAYVSPADLAEELVKIDPKWYEPKKEKARE